MRRSSVAAPAPQIADVGRAVLSVLACIANGATSFSADPSGVEFFEKHVRPVLVEHCQSCHGRTRAKAGLRLDTADGLKAGGESGPAVVPGEPKRSRLVEAVEYGNADLQMPPKGKLPPQAIEALTKWVALGVPFPSQGGANHSDGPAAAFDLAARKQAHWCWKPLAKTNPRAVLDSRWTSHPVDAFLQARREAAGVVPAAEAGRSTLLRRLHFDLVGLPPTPEEVLAFEADASPDAWTKVVDRLLASPQFGERWARHWLDLARYAESRGHEHDHTQPNAFQYRDWVIRALNADVRYDQFVVEQIAGDLLTSPRRHPKEGFNESVLGTGFWVLGEQIHSPVDLKQDEADRVDNSLDVMSKTFLGLTVSCARCHDHKFDAISARDYYALAGFVLGAHYRQVRVEDGRNAEVAAKLGRLQETTRSEVLKALAAAVQPALSRGADRWKGPIADAASQSNQLRRFAGNHGDAKKTRWLLDFSDSKAAWMADGASFGEKPARPGDLQLTEPVRLATLAAAEKSPIADRLRPASGCDDEPGGMGGMNAAGRTLRTPTYTLQSGRIHYLMRGKARVYAAVQSHTMVAGPLHGTIVRRLDAGPNFRWVSHDLSVYPSMRVHFEFVPEPNADFALAAVVEGDVPSTPAAPNASPEQAAELMQTAVAEWRRGSAEHSAALANWWLERSELWDEAGGDVLKKTLAGLRTGRDSLLRQVKEEAPLAPAVAEGTGVDLQVFLRGSPKALGTMARRRMLEALVGDSASPSVGSGRLELARQLVDPSMTPLVPRVAVNRIWHHLFGRGVVASVDNFGVLGEPPTHPELLDFLAAEFVADGWSIKRAIRRLVTTRTYRLASQSDPAMEERDPGNRLWRRMPVRRLDGEAVRDAMLAVSGGLDRAMFGRAVPVHLTEFQDGRGRPASGPLDGAGRRSVYLAVRRNFLSPFLLAYDTPIPFSTVGRRTDSNVPAQVLALMNDPFVRQQSERWAAEVRKSAKDETPRIDLMYLQAFARKPTPLERQAVARYLSSNARGDDAWNHVAHALFNAKEFCFVH